MQTLEHEPPSRALGVVALLAIAVLSARRAEADSRDLTDGTGGVTQVQATGGAGHFLPLTLAGTVGIRPAYALGSGGWDGARKSALLEAIAEVQIWGPVAIRGGAVYSDSDGKLAPTLGARVQGLSESRHGVDGSLGLFYKPEGLTEPEGEIEAVVALGTHLLHTLALVNLAYGQDPEGNERDGEVRLAVVHPIASHFLIGVDSRLRFDLGSDAGHLAARGEPTFDALVGPTATWFVDRFALLLHAGLGTRRVDSSSTTGPFVLAGIGSAF